jgi:quercetin dioxygenase-like cupin family protein
MHKQKRQENSVRNPRDIAKDLRAGRISRREFVQWAADGAFSLAATSSLLGQAAHAQATPDSGHAHDVHHHDHAASHDDSYDYNQTNLDPYAEWLKTEGIPVYRDFAVTDLRALELKPWSRVGGLGAHVNLIGGEGVNTAYVCELPPGAATNPQRYLFEETIYILDGEGESEMWAPRGHKYAVQWKAGSVLGPPLNMWRRHINRGSKPARFLSVNNAPVVIDLFHNSDFVFNNDYVFRDRFDEAGEFLKAGDDKIHSKTIPGGEQPKHVHMFHGSFIPDARTIGLKTSASRGKGNSRIELELSNNTMQTHISEFSTGTYKMAHRHGPGSHVVTLNGQGYTLFWKGSTRYSEATEKKRVDWTDGSLFVPPDGWFHQHFNTGRDAARYIAPNWGGDGRWFMEGLGGGGYTHLLDSVDVKKGGNMVEYEDEDPQVREMYVAELNKSGIKFNMDTKKRESE